MACELWESARTKGSDRGFVLHGECPIEASCIRPKCRVIFASGELQDTGLHQMEKFLIRQQKTDQITLERLRHELRGHFKSRKGELTRRISLGPNLP